MKPYYCPYIILLLALITVTGFGAPVNPGEALAIADVWYAMELNSGNLKITEKEKAERIARIGNHRVSYMVSRDELTEEYPAGRTVLAYIVEYVPNGFAVVSGDDRIAPLMVCSAESEFRWDQPERNFLRFYLGRVMPALWDRLPAQTHGNWTLLRAKLPESKDKVAFDKGERAVNIQWGTANWNQGNYYNDTCAAHNGNNDVLTGCVATALAIKMHCHGWPLVGNSSHNYSDTLGSIQYSHSVNHGVQSYDWAAMPYANLTAPNSEVARVMYHGGVSVNMDYEMDFSGASTYDVAAAMNSHFRYRGTLGVYDTTGPDAHEAAMIKSIIGILPVQIGGWGHSVLCDGYRDDAEPNWHVNCGWGGANNGWYYLTNLPGGSTTVIRVSCPYAQPNNWTYIDSSWAGAEDGRIAYPYNTLTEGEAASINGGKLLVKGGTYTGAGNVPVTINNGVVIRAFGGNVTMGDNLWLMNYESILLHETGGIRITSAK